MRQYAQATTRNRDPILAALARIVPAGARVLEIASGTGEHVAYFASRLPAVSFQPSDLSEEARASIEAWRNEAKNVAPPIALDVTARPWDLDGPFDAIVCINMIHIAPWAACDALLGEAPRHLRPRGVLFLYGPFLRSDVPTVESNVSFDRSLRARNPSWGVRELDEVVALAEKRGLRLDEIVEMPANNLSVVLRLP